MQDFALSLAQNFTDPVFLIFGVIALFLIKGWKWIWVFPVLGLAMSAAFGGMGQDGIPLASSLAQVVGMSMLGFVGMFGREYLGSGFGRSAT